MSEINHEAVKDGYRMAKAIFLCRSLPEVSWNLEGLIMHFGLECSDVDFGLNVWQTDNDSGKKQEGITFHPYLDLDDARRIAGAIIAWADHAESRAKIDWYSKDAKYPLKAEVFLDGYPDPVTIERLLYSPHKVYYEVRFADGSHGAVEQTDITEGNGDG
jgi:hypothetical protein